MLPYVTTAREGVARLAELLETYGTYESNGIIISDVNEIWYVETIGGHHWIARRVPDDCYATIPNQLGIDDFDFDDAFSTQREFMCSADLREFMDAHHLDRTMSAGASSGFGFQSTSVFGNASMNGGGNSSSGAALGHNHFNPRTAFGTATTKTASTTRHVPGICSATSIQARTGIRRPPATRPHPTIFRGVVCLRTL